MKSSRAALNYANTHRELIEECREGKRQAQFELYKHYNRAMYNVCLRMLHHEQDAEDVLQQSFVQVFKKLDSFRYESAIGAWIKRIVVNNCINSLKKRRMVFDEWDNKIDAVENPVEFEKTANPSVHRIKNAMMKLPDGYRSVFSLYAIEGYDHGEIGQILGVSEATSKSQYSRARKKLQGILKTGI